jgi:ABC-type multidrug transport system permease subunit
MRDALRTTLAFTLLDFRHIRRDRGSIFWMVVMPFAFMAFFGQAFRQAADPTPRNRAVTLEVRDEDDSEISRAIVASFDSTRFRLLPPVDPAEVPEGEEAPLRPRVLTLPAGLQDSVFAGGEADVRVLRQGGALENQMAADAGILRALVRLHGALAAASPDSTGWTDSTRAAFVAMTTRPPRVKVDARWTGAPPIPGGMGQSVPGNLVTFVLMSTVLQAGVLLVSEKVSGALRRVTAQPVGRFEILAGKILSRYLLSLAQVVLLLVGARLIFGYVPGPSIGAFSAVAAAFALTAVGLGMLAGAAFSTVKQAAMVGWISALLMAAIGGAWWPLEVVSGPLRAFAHLFPTAWAMDGLTTVTVMGGGLADVATPIAVLLAMGLALCTASAWLLRVNER